MAAELPRGSVLDSLGGFDSSLTEKEPRAVSVHATYNLPEHADAERL